MQSFAGKVKNELCRTPVQRLRCARAEAYGVLLYGNPFSPTEVRLITESADLQARLPLAVPAAFGLKFDRLPQEGRGEADLSASPTGQSWTTSSISWDTTPGRIWCCTSTSPCWRRSAAGRPSCGGPFWRGQRHRPGKALPPGACRQCARPAGSYAPTDGDGLSAPQRPIRVVAPLFTSRSEHIEDLLTTIGAPAAAMDIMTAKRWIRRSATGPTGP